MASGGGELTPEQYEMLFGEPPPGAESGPPPPAVGADRFNLSQAAAPPPIQISEAPAPPPPAPRPDRPWWKKKRFILPTGTVLLLAAVSVAVNPEDTQSVSSADSVAAENDASSDAPATTQAPATTTEAPVDESTIPAPVPGQTTLTSAQLALITAVLADATIVESLVADVPYDRDAYTGGGWGDADDDCISDRHEILIEESVTTVGMSEDNCRVETGTWIDRYDGTTYTSENEVTIDHLVPLAAAHRAGGWAWDEDTKRAFSADITFPAAHAVVGETTNQAKADNEPDEWRPAQADWCQYAVDWISVKTRWGLNYSISEHEALLEMLDTCQPINSLAGEATPIPLASITTSTVPEPASTTTTTTTTTTEAPTTTTEAAAPGEPDVFVASCNAHAETVVLTNRGGTAITLSGWVLHDEGRKHETGLGNITLGPDEKVTLLSGQDTDEQANAVRWSHQNVWNNDGDRASLLNGSTLVSSASC